jgi:hypothetical protein
VSNPLYTTTWLLLYNTSCSDIASTNVPQSQIHMCDSRNWGAVFTGTTGFDAFQNQVISTKPYTVPQQLPLCVVMWRQYFGRRFLDQTLELSMRNGTRAPSDILMRSIGSVSQVRFGVVSVLVFWIGF